MAFNPVQIYPIDLNASKAVGVDIPFNGSSVFKSNYLTKDAIKNNLINFFLTNPGERYMNPNFGGGLREFIFVQINNNNFDFLLEDIRQKISNYFPNVNIKNLQIFQINNSNGIKIKLDYNILNTNIEDNLEIELT
jgi:phage baseplate assembly protein W